ncbi:hypothetical protein Pmar_PMAR021959 [Perkinsus marinus ATCC 50983]|uniref:Uncharacterized protein n=1 Tax=Perkinsus marinus (strain ATCC 50983 / TXsc) TaxID=423536 RepID=C5LMY4_PERM5|nr:hypothetical protein Pmar_PMAR021959 [Perkinsus marinus ATCC 50983]EER01909.1 hypothetical protein Pmar_PMAR021959 [Perkinsus marinus ATCC 50983]|eukprot:XP_002769191.1 hypothetical protein Pmar_PMAR021959 [Perkinsus marinus ATCC 50983]
MDSQVEVTEAWRRLDIETILLVQIFNDITITYEYWDVVHLSVDRGDKNAIKIYEGMEFIKIIGGHTPQ